MSLHMVNSIEKLKKNVVNLGGIVETQLKKSITGLKNEDVFLCEEVIKGDHMVDEFEIEIEEQALQILALYQPVANDLRFIASVLKINNDLERVGDLAANIAKKAIYVIQRFPNFFKQKEIDFEDAETKTLTIFKDSLDAFVRLDTDKSRRVCVADDGVDKSVRSARKVIKDKMKQNPNEINFYLKYIDIFRHLERIADLATNIAEDTIYLSEGTIVRHGRLKDLEDF